MTKVFLDIDQTVIRGRTHLMVLSHFGRKRWFGLCFWFGLAWHGAIYQFQVWRGCPDASRLIKQIYTFLAGRSIDEFKKEINELYDHRVKKMILRDALRETAGHLESGREIILISTALEPLAELIGRDVGASQVVASRPAVRGDRLTGGFERIVFAEEKLVLAEALSRDLSGDYFYSDCFSDLPLLEKVGFPRAVNSDRRLRRKAQQMNWPVHNWHN